MTVTQMARMSGGNALESWYARHPEEIGMKTGDLPPAGFVNPWAAPGSDRTGMDPDDWEIIEVSDAVKKEVKDDALQHMKDNFGMSGTGRGINDIISDYCAKIDPKDRYNALRTITQIHRDEVHRLYDFVASRVPGWQVGQAFDTNILDEYQRGIDFKA